MRRKTFPVVILGRMVIALILALCLVLASSNSAAALSLGDHFRFSHSVEFSKTQINGSETFTATVQATANCTKDLPLPYSLASKVEITGRIVAEHQETGATVVLNTDGTYTVTITDFPKKAGATAQVSQSISLRFPQGSQSGSYSVTAELVEARAGVAFIWYPVTDYLPSSQVGGSVTYSSSSGGGGGGGGGGSAPEPGTNDVSDFVNNDGTFTETVIAESFDAKAKLIINEGTVGRDRDGRRLTEITMTLMVDWLAPPENSNIIGVIYDLGPDGATFDPPITLTITYDTSEIPENVIEDKLVIAMWDDRVGDWVSLPDNAVHTEINTITAAVSHFTAFTVLTHIPQAVFIASGLSITPAEVPIGEEVTISTLISNTGDLTGSHNIILRIDKVTTASKEITLEAGANEKISFTVVKRTAGSYTVTIDGLSGAFVVKGPTTFAFSELLIIPKEAAIGEEVTISALITNTGNFTGSYKATLMIDNAIAASKEVTLEVGANEEINFTVVKRAAGTYTVTIDGLSGTFSVKRPDFTLSKLSITPEEAAIGEEVTISALVTNTGSFAGIDIVTLMIDGAAVARKEVTLEAGANEEISFTVIRRAVGIHTVTIDDMSGTFSVKRPATFVARNLSIIPAEVAAGEEITISVLIVNTGGLAGSHKVILKIDDVTAASKEVTLEAGANEKISFTVVKHAAGIHAVTIDDISGTFSVKPAGTLVPVPAKAMNFGVIGSIVAVVVIVGLLVYFFVWRKRGAKYV